MVEKNKKITLDEIIQLENKLDAANGDVKSLARLLEQKDDSIILHPSKESIERAERLLFLQSLSNEDLGDKRKTPAFIWLGVAACACFVIVASWIAINSNIDSSENQNLPKTTTSININDNPKVIKNEYSTTKIVDNKTSQSQRQALNVVVVDVPTNKAKSYHISSGQCHYEVSILRQQTCKDENLACFNVGVKRLNTTQQPKSVSLTVRQKPTRKANFSAYYLSGYETADVTLPVATQQFQLSLKDSSCSK